MAKISARGATELARCKAKLTGGTLLGEFLLRSDGRVLRKFAGAGEGWKSTELRLKNPGKDSQARLEVMVQDHGFSVAK
jgi:hypothetical protein